MNREIVQPSGAGIYPLTGDVQSSAGSPTVTVVGIQHIPFEAIAPLPGSGIQYNQTQNMWQPTLIAQIQCNGISLSDDPWVSVNARKPVEVNGA